MSVVSAIGALAGRHSGSNEEAIARIQELRDQAVNREADEIVDGRTEVAHYYTGVADGLEAALNELDGVEGGVQ